MTLAAGVRLGPYEIVAPLGAGGMGEVYRARDTRLGREVAVKVLPAEVASDPERLRRFEQEARAASALNHPHILTVHDIGADEGTAFLVTELLAGESLRERLREGPLPWRRAIEIAGQVARGLAAAHDRGIVHRDLKPENLFLTEHGVAKILDFGLARVDRPELAGASLEQASTMFETAAGTVLGTVGYMAPEQVRGERADARSDLFALGVVLHELLTGANPFRRDSVVESLSAILKESAPELPAIVPGAPPGLARAVARLLEKRPADRFQSARDLAFALDELGVASSAEAAPAAPLPGRARHGLRLLLAAAAGAAIAVAGTLVLAGPNRDEEAGSPTTVRFQLLPPAEHGLPLDGRGGYLAVSPRGDALVFAAADATGAQRLWLRLLAEAEPRPLPGTDDASLPFWSPDGGALAFAAGGRLRRLELAGGGPVDLCELDRSFSGGSWSEDDTLLLGFGFGTGSARGIARVSARGGRPEPVTELDAARGEVRHLAPVALPGGAFVYLARDRDGGRRLWAARPGGGARPLVESQSGAAYAAGHLFYTAGGRLWAHRFDPRTLDLAGEPVVLSPQLRFLVYPSSAIYAVGGELLAFQADDLKSNDRQLVWYDRDGRTTSAFPPGRHGSPAVSRDGRRVVSGTIVATDGTIHIWLRDLERGTAEALTRGATIDVNPAWCGGGRTVVFTRQLADGSNRIVELDLLARRERIVAEEPDLFAYHCPEEGNELLVRSRAADGVAYETLDLGTGARRRLIETSAAGRADLAPGGGWLATDETTDAEPKVFVWDLSGATPRVQIASGGFEPRWAPDGRALLYLGVDGTLHSVAVTHGSGRTRFGTPRRLFAVQVSRYGTSYSLAGDGRILVNTRVRDETLAPITVVAGWRRLLARR